MRRALAILVAVAGLAYLGLCTAVYLGQRSMLYHPVPRVVTAPQSTLRLAVDGAELVVTVRPHAGPKAILYFGGNGEDVSKNLASFEEWFPEHALYLLHYRGYGGSTGHPTEEANHRDAVALFKRVQAEHPEVAIIGRSLGSGVAVRLASEQPASRLVLVTPYDSIEELAAAAYPFLPVSWLLLDKYESWRYAPAVKAPTTLIEAENDEVIPHASTERLLGRFARGVASMSVMPGLGHNDLAGRGEYRSALQAAL
ncbi:MAG: alpha/beta hydrolase [Myxococcaceae bacterium]